MESIVSNWLPIVTEWLQLWNPSYLIEHIGAHFHAAGIYTYIQTHITAGIDTPSGAAVKQPVGCPNGAFRAPLPLATLVILGVLGLSISFIY